MTEVRSEVTGTVWQLEVVEGHTVAAGDALAIIESMKMEIPIEAPTAGTVRTLRVAKGDNIVEGDIVAIIA